MKDKTASTKLRKVRSADIRRYKEAAVERARLRAERSRQINVKVTPAVHAQVVKFCAANDVTQANLIAKALQHFFTLVNIGRAINERY